MANPYAPPNAPVSDSSRLDEEFEYAGFWVRLGAYVIDIIILLIITMPLLFWIYGSEYFLDEKQSMVAGTADWLISYVFPAVATIVFWRTKQATPGKMILSLRVVDADTGGKLSVGQSIGRYFAYIPSGLVLGLGFLWIAFDDRKQGWHDKLAGTLVVRG